jgi:hypothetical protein
MLQAICHCLDCRKIHGTTYSTNLGVSEGSFRLEQGTPKTYSKVADSGNTVTSNFCGDCGTTVWREGESFPGLKVIKAGVLDDVDALDKARPGLELFVPRRVSWVPELANVEQKRTMS